MQTVKTDVVIVGGGPAGLMLAIELGCRNIDCVLLEKNATTSEFPKANATSSRTMEHYRRRGFSDEIRSLGLPEDYPQDVAYFTRFAQHELARLDGATRRDVLQTRYAESATRASWPTPEPLHRVQQVLIEPILRKHAQTYRSVQLCFGYSLTAFAQTDSRVEATAVNAETGEEWLLHAEYIVGCDGARSLVRKTLGIEFHGVSDDQRNFFGGQMLSIMFRSRQLCEILASRRAWQYWALNPTQRGVLVALDGESLFNLGVQLKPGQSAADLDFSAISRSIVGAPHDFELLGTMPWTAGYTLVAERFRQGRALIAGDAAHLFTPTGGMGYNTSVDDAVNLGWKLAQVTKGAACPELLDSYEAERRPVAQRNTAFARRMADSIGRMPVTPDIEADDVAGAAARHALGEALKHHASAEFDIPGLQLGVCYSGSPIVAKESASPPDDDPNHYVPSTYPGARAPHAIWKGRPLFDYFGRDFTLVCFSNDGHQRWIEASQQLGVDLVVLALDDPIIQQLYGASCVLIRPDHHVAWRGDLSSPPEQVLRSALGLHAADIRHPETA